MTESNSLTYFELICKANFQAAYTLQTIYISLKKK